MRFRTHLPLDIQVTFPTKKDKAAWRATGSPPLGVNGGITAHGTDVRLVVDPATAQLLDYEVPGAGEYLAFERQGWVNRIGAIPTS